MFIHLRPQKYDPGPWHMELVILGSLLVLSIYLNLPLSPPVLSSTLFLDIGERWWTSMRPLWVEVQPTVVFGEE